MNRAIVANNLYIFYLFIVLTLLNNFIQLRVTKSCCRHSNSFQSKDFKIYTPPKIKVASAIISGIATIDKITERVTVFTA